MSAQEKSSAAAIIAQSVKRTLVLLPVKLVPVRLEVNWMDKESLKENKVSLETAG
jgi:hypothetical protein